MFTPFIPTSGLAGYNSLIRTQSQQIETLSQDPEVARDIAYFEDNISKVRSASELVADRRLLEVALTAYGLESEIDKGAFIQQVLEQGVEDDAALANRLNDPRWVDFATDFSFGDANAGYDVSVFQASVELKFRQPSVQAPRISDVELAGFRAGIGSITSIDDLLADSTTLEVALAAFDLEREFYTDGHFRALIESGSIDGGYAEEVDDGKWRTFTDAFLGLETGGTMEQVSVLRVAVEKGLKLEAASVDNISFNIFQNQIDSVESVDDFLETPDLLAMTLAGFGLEDETLSQAEIEGLLRDAAAGDFRSARGQDDEAWVSLAETFNAALGGATVSRMEYKLEVAIADEGLDQKALALAPSGPSVAAEELAYFTANVGTVSTSDDLLADRRLLDVALAAFGLENEEASDDFIKSILDESPDDPNAFVNIISDERWRDFARAFNPSETTGTNPALWQYTIEENLIANGAPQSDLDIVRRNFNLIDSNLDFILSPELLDVTISAFGLPKDTFTSNFFLGMVLSDPLDDNSLVNQFGDDGWRQLVGVLGTSTQGRSDLVLESFVKDVTDRYLERSFEVAVGEQDQSIRLALNFARDIGRVAEGSSVATTGWLQIMGSEPLRRVIDSALGLPAEFAQLEIEAQETVYRERSLAVFGGEDPSIFRDQAVVVDVLTRFFGAQDQSQADLSGARGFAAIQLMQQTATFAQRGLF